MKGYKATDKDMKCMGFQFTLGVWHEHAGLVELCKSGFHFCDQPSGPWCYYADPGTRIFEVEAEDVLDVEWTPGVEFKRVCRRIKLVKEVTPGLTGDDKSNTGNSNTGSSNTGSSNTGYSNTGYSNTGDSNTGSRNTGYSNTGDWNTGDRNTGSSNTGSRNTGNSNTGSSNTGSSNTGYSNTGYSNTGDSNTGSRNTGYSNTGYSNTGDRNTGSSNTGSRNTGNSNTGNWNATNHSAGMFCVKEPRLIIFDKQTKLTRDQFFEKYPEAYELGRLLMRDEEIPLTPYNRIPGITKAKLKALHEKHKAGRQGAKT